MKFLINIFLTAALGFGLGFYLPWYALPIACFLIALLLKLTPGQAFLSTLIGAIIYAGVYTITLDNLNDGMLARKMSAFIFKQENRLYAILASIFIVSYTAAMASWAGSLWLKKQRKVVVAKSE